MAQEIHVLAARRCEIKSSTRRFHVWNVCTREPPSYSAQPRPRLPTDSFFRNATLLHELRRVPLSICSPRFNFAIRNSRENPSVFVIDSASRTLSRLQKSNCFLLRGRDLSKLAIVTSTRVVDFIAVCVTNSLDTKLWSRVCV